jgi:uncharacterized peroxidase-related enzyme
MSRFPTPASIDAAPAASRPLLSAVEKQLGVVPNMFRLFGHHPIALEGYLGLSGALGRGLLPLSTRQRLALVVAERNGCDYCLSAHTYLGKHLARLDDAEMTANRAAGSEDPKAKAALVFASRIVAERGHVTPGDVAAVRAAGYSDPELLEIVLQVALNTLTNYVNTVGQTDIDFPLVTHRPR